MIGKISVSQRKILLWVIPVFLFCSNTGCKQERESLRQSRINVHWIGPLTGQARMLGGDNIKAIQLAFEQYDEDRSPHMPEIRIQAHDDQYHAKNTVRIYNELKNSEEEEVDVVFLNTYEAMFDLAGMFWQDQVLVINPIDNDLKLAGLNRNIFLIAKRTEQLAAVISNALISDQQENTAIIYYNSDSFMPLVASDIRNQYTKAGFPLSMYPYDANEMDFSKIIPEKDLRKFHSFVLLGYTEMEYVLQYIRKVNTDAEIYSVNTLLALAGKSDLAPLIEGMKIAHFTSEDGNVEKAKEFLNLFKEKYGAMPNVEWIAFQAYDAANIFLRSIRNVYEEPDDKPLVEAMRQDLRAGRVYQGVTGDITVNVDGTSDGIYMGYYKIEKGKPVRLP